MKIRTDFVTNSSSSSFTIRLEISTKSGEKFISQPDLDGLYGGGFWGEMAVNCTPNDILNADSVDTLYKLLNKSIALVEEDEEYGGMFKGMCQSASRKATELMKETVSDINELESIAISRIWAPWGEGNACCPLYNDYKLKELAEALVTASDDAKGKKRSELEKYLKTNIIKTGLHYGDREKFMGLNTPMYYKWDHLCSTIDEFAQMVLEGTPDNDLTKETVFINLEDRTVSSDAKFVLNFRDNEKGTNLYVQEIDYQRSTNYFRRIIVSNFSDVEIRDNVDVSEITEGDTGESSKIDLLLLKDEKPVLAIAIIKSTDAKAKPVKNLKSICTKANIPYLRFISNEENPDKKVVSKLKKIINSMPSDFLDDLNNRPANENKIDLPRFGKGHQVEVIFDDKRHHTYNCFADVKVGDIVYVDGARKGMPGKVLEVICKVEEKEDSRTLIYPVVALVK